MELNYPMVTADGRIYCQECGGVFSLITPAHLKKHNITFAEYKLKYPDCPISDKAYKAARYEQRESVLFKSNEDIERELVEEKLKSNQPPPSVIDYKGLHKNKIPILQYLHETYPHLENNYYIEKRHFHSDLLLYRFITDAADPVQKIIFDFPDAYWHNVDFPPAPHKHKKLEEDGWKIYTFKGKYPTDKEVRISIDTITDI